MDMDIGVDKLYGTLTDEDLEWLALASHPGFECTPEVVAKWISDNEDIRILNLMFKNSRRSYLE